MKQIAVSIVVCAAMAAALRAQTSIKTTGNIESAEQLVSTKATGTAPLAVSSTTMVDNLNADQVDGIEGTELDSRLTNAETLLVAVQNQVSALGLAKVPRTGQATCYETDGTVTTCGSDIGLAQDGDLQLGVVWPNPRFGANGDGTVTDNLTGLIWLASANCLDPTSWDGALDSARGLFDGSTNDAVGSDCGLADGSMSGAWRLPNVRELQSLVHYGFDSPPLPNTAGTGKCDELAAPTECAFSGVSSRYWSSSTFASGTNAAWAVDMVGGQVSGYNKTSAYYVWLVRGGQ